MLKKLAYVFIGGGAGSVLRYLISFSISKYWESTFPSGTFIVNITGCLLIGLLMGFGVRHDVFNQELRYLLVIGFCGGYTTFSAFSAEGLKMLQTGNHAGLLIYVSASVILGAGACWAGFKMAY